MKDRTSGDRASGDQSSEAAVARAAGECSPRRSRWLVRALLVVANVGALGCTELAAGDDTLEPPPMLPSQGGTTGMGTNPLEPAPDPVWGCLEEAPSGTAQPLRPNVALSLQIADPNTGMTPQGLTARACRRFDVNCLSPITPATSASEDGLFHLVVDYEFDGFVEITSSVTVPTLFFVNEPLRTDTSDSIAIVTPPGLQALALQGGVTLDGMRGHLFIRAFDCQGMAASNVELSINKDGIPFVFSSGLPTVGSRVTTDGGSGGFVNVPPGLTALQGLLEGGRVSGSENVVVRAGWFTYGDLEPQSN